MKKNADFGETLKSKGLKNTKHRISVLQILDKSPQPATAEQIFLALKEKNTSINLSSVYRILDSLYKNEIVIKSVPATDRTALFELNRLKHTHHLICSSCNRMFSVCGCPLKEYENSLQKKFGFDITGHKLEIYGICSECRTRAFK